LKIEDVRLKLEHKMLREKEEEILTKQRNKVSFLSCYNVYNIDIN